MKLLAFFQCCWRKARRGPIRQLLIETSAMIGARQNPAELAAWFTALPSSSEPEKYLAGLTRGLRLVGARNLRVPGAERSLGAIALLRQANRFNAPHGKRPAISSWPR